MQLNELLPREHIFVPLGAVTLREALGAMLRRLGQAREISDPDAFERLLGDARLRDVVAIGERVALPHYRTDAVDQLIVALGVAPQPLRAKDAGLDIEPTIVLLVLAPPEAATLYLRTVSTLAAFFRDEATVERIARATGPEEVLQVPGLADLKIQPSLTVRDIMAQEVQALAPDQPVRQAVDLFGRRGLRVAPVVGEKGEVLGVVTDRELMRALLPELPRVGGAAAEGAGSIAPQLRVRDIMSRSVLCVSEDMGLDEVASIMINKDVEQIPVVREGKLSGFLTRGDIIRKLFGR